MDERWMKALAAKNITVKGQTKNGASHMNGGNGHTNKMAVHAASHTSMRHAQPFKATGHKGGISRQGS
ncbi:hypothetical protein [Bifidobacterium cebidarum]|uniref:Uncharacterized protein n=1 Tax=Bifidobacterium cebidarum TaxID=2650773 RepID=A0A6I1GP87_9BIFI|nr:hypothetical protein [Bifidobacterium cebidarum]KAB7788371.1 hypothetical protein F7D08_1112 [Bifidobacterium cebidarum]